MQALGAFQGLGREQDALCAEGRQGGGRGMRRLRWGMFPKRKRALSSFVEKGLDWMVGNWEEVTQSEHPAAPDRDLE